MHPDEVVTDARLVRRLLAAQFPRWAELPIRAVTTAGTDNAIFRLGDEVSVRMPRRPSAAGQVEKEHLWLPRLAQNLPCALPEPIALGAAAEDYPFQWSVCRWLEGENAYPPRRADTSEVAADLAGFVAALKGIDTTHGPAPGAHNFWRGVPLALRDGPTRKAIVALQGTVDAAAVTAAWEADLGAPPWVKPPVWIHGDLCPGNLLLQNGRLSGVIDFGGLGVGDPACDLIVAWNLFTRPTREVYRAALNPDAATWARGRGWALSIALIQLPYYRHRNPVLAANAKLTIDAVLAEHDIIV